MKAVRLGLLVLVTICSVGFLQSCVVYGPGRPRTVVVAPARPVKVMKVKPAKVKRVPPGQMKKHR